MARSGVRIDPTAIVHSSADIGEGSVIGPYCVIGSGVELGQGCKLHAHVVISGPTIIGDHNEFYPYACIGQRTQDLKYEGEPTGLEIGTGNVFREFCTVHRATGPGGRTRVGNHGNFLAYTHIAHDCVIGDHVIFSNNSTLAGHVLVEDNAILGGLTAIHQFCRIGRFAITGGCTKVVQDVPPFIIADGNPARPRGINKIGLDRHHFSAEEIHAVREAYKAVYMRDQLLDVALNELKEAGGDGGEHVRHFVRFIEGSERGIVR